MRVIALAITAAVFAGFASTASAHGPLPWVSARVCQNDASFGFQYKVIANSPFDIRQGVADYSTSMLGQFEDISLVSLTYTPTLGTPFTVSTSGATGWGSAFASFTDGANQYYTSFWQTTNLAQPAQFTLGVGETATVDFVLNVSHRFVEADHTIVDPSTPLVDAHCQLVGA